MAASAASASAPTVPSPTRAVGRQVEQRLQRQPLRGEAVQGRQARDRRGADQERPSRPWHPPEQAAEPVELQRTDRLLECARSQEEQCLEQRVVDGMQQCGGEREPCPGIRAAGAQDETGADPEHDDPDVLDRVKRQQSLQVVLEQRIEDTAERRERSRPDHDEPEPERQDPQPVDQDADEPVDRDLDHHSAHQRGHRRRRHRMRARQPHVQRDQPRLRPHPDQGGEGDGDLQRGPRRKCRGAAERACLREQQHRNPGARPAEVGAREVDEHRSSRTPTCVVRDEDHGRRDQRHQLPTDQERQRITRAHNCGKHEHEHTGQQRRHPFSPRRAEVARRSRGEPEPRQARASPGRGRSTRRRRS